MPALFQVLILLFLGLFVLVTVTKKYPVNLSEKQGRTLMYVAMGAMALAAVVSLFRLATGG
ncbi:hypothetical protein ACFOSD_00705 [Salinispirillum marinum]|uniref:Uncharacterized protein n=2 Tax=Saccharospirillaceae TaxID=255527 RepID=A0ABV8BCR9_9GAMM